MPDCIIKTNKLMKEFKSESGPVFTAVKDVNIEIKKGEIFCLTGPNGAGKTTLLKMLCGLVIPTSGSAMLCGYNIFTDIVNIKPLLGLAAFPENSFFGDLTARQNLEFFASLYNLGAKDTASGISAASGLLGMSDLLDKRFQNLSAGMKQKAQIARSLLNPSEVLLLDEPTKSLDAGTASKLRNHLKELSVREQRTIFYITHNPEEAKELSSRIAVMDRGRIDAAAYS